ncbi:hypothetical protein DL96DRAFT_1714929 [Flagelloscypha sp. PMI_526]|nr:hypothetical protein DL96DRAFT_1714929 [Flagelloscypha sp. PMI_526]
MFKLISILFLFLLASSAIAEYNPQCGESGGPLMCNYPDVSCRVNACGGAASGAGCSWCTLDKFHHFHTPVSVQIVKLPAPEGAAKTVIKNVEVLTPKSVRLGFG